ncbi:hypothetical protein H0H92_007991 [Tricholoma furcatifolium]|nr:hypothetical protein H0H92_007991 [Tricholoma furcatifolium]
MTTPSSSVSFSPNERVLCYHGPLIYEAKVLKVDNFTDATTTTGALGPHCFVHYKGWKQTWDEWVPHNRLLKHNETNIELQKTLQRSNAASAAPGASSSRGPKPGTKDGPGAGRGGARKDGTRGTKRTRDEEDSSKKPELKLNLPEILKVQLVDDWEAVTKNNQLVTLPRTPTVVELLNEFAEHVTRTKPAHLRDPVLLIPSIVSGLIVYFDRSLGANLLYRFERPQFAEVRRMYKTGQQVIIGQEKEVSAVYGAEHLLRMIGMIANSGLDPESVTLVRDYVNELLDWMTQERSRIFQTEYETTTVQYQNISRS